MSKIEDALKKSRKNLSLNVEDKNALKRDLSGVKDIAISKLKSQDFKSVTLSREIALMDEDQLLGKQELANLKIISSDMQDDEVANAYRDLRTKLLQKSQGNNFIIMVTSCANRGASSSTTVNLATAFSFVETKTSLMVDCNLTNPQLDKVLKIDASQGLTDYLKCDDVDIESIIHKTGIKRLRYIPAGTSTESAAEYFTSSRMRELMSDLLKRYSDRYIFIDTAPILSSADTRIIVELCDYVILTVPYGAVTKNKIKEAAESIGPEKLLGVVFSDIPNIPDLKLSALK